jgi:NAD(P)-dependent dehydrogenase (short-subunit alcohol dehydrogenase family)
MRGAFIGIHRWHPRLSQGLWSHAGVPRKGVSHNMHEARMYQEDASGNVHTLSLVTKGNEGVGCAPYSASKAAMNSLTA